MNEPEICYKHIFWIWLEMYERTEVITVNDKYLLSLLSAHSTKQDIPIILFWGEQRIPLKWN